MKKVSATSDGLPLVNEVRSSPSMRRSNGSVRASPRLTSILSIVVRTCRFKVSLDITHYIKTFHRKPGALPNARVLAQVDEQILDLFNRYYLDDPKGFLSILDLMRETSPETLSYALTILNEQNINPTYDTLRFFLHQINGTEG